MFPSPHSCIATEEIWNSYVAIFYFPRRNEKILRTYHLILPKFHLILPKNFFFPPEEISISSGGIWEIPRVTWNKTRLLPKSTVSQSCLQDCLDFAERMKRKALKVRSEGSIHPYVTEAESRKQHSDSPLCNSLPLAPRDISNTCFWVVILLP